MTMPPEPDPDHPCCPQLEPCEPCDEMSINYRLPFTPVVDGITVPVEVTLKYTHKRCPGPLALGPLVHTTTLLPGEKVRLATTDRHSTFSVDSSSQVSYFNRASSEESFYNAGFAQCVSDVSIVDSTRRASTYHESAVGGGGGAGLDLGFFEIGGSVSASSFDSSSVSTIARNFSQHARTSSAHTESGVRAASSVSVGSVASRSHTEGESQDHFESASRVFENPNRCRALTFLFHQIVKCQHVEFTFDGADIRVVDRSVPTGVVLNPPRPLTGIGVVSQVLSSTDPQLAEKEKAGRAAAMARTSEVSQNTGITGGFIRQLAAAIDPELARRAEAMVLDQLVAAGLLNQDGTPSEDAQERLGWTRDLVLPTPGVQVRTCLDECTACEPELHKKIQLELERMELENRKLAREIELMDRDKDHRCCSDDGNGTPPEPGPEPSPLPPAPPSPPDQSHHTPAKRGRFLG